MENKTYLAMNNGKDVNGGAQVYQGEGFIAGPCYYKEAGERQSYATITVAISRNPWSIISAAEVEAQKNNANCSEDKPFIQLVGFGAMADRIKELEKGQKVLFCGKARKREYKTKEGIDGAQVQVVVERVLKLPTSKHSGDEMVPGFAILEDCYNGKTEKRACLLTGRVLAPKPLSEYNGTPVKNFMVELEGSVMDLAKALGCEVPAGENTYRRIQCSVWGRRAAAADKLAVEGAILSLVGPVRVTNKDGNVYFGLNVREFSVMKFGVRPETPASAEAEAEELPISAADVTDETDEALPF